MGKPNKPTKWFKAVKKAFRSPSKERPQDQDQDTKIDADDQKLLAKHDLPPVSHQEPTPYPLPSFEIITHDEVEPGHSRGKPLPTPEAVDPAISAQLPDKALEKVVEEENLVEGEDHTNNNADGNVEKHQDDDDDSTLSEEEEAAIRIQQRFSEPLALKGLVRLQALVRGHQVRRQAATTLLTMEAIVRVQSVFRGRRARMSKDGRAVRSRISKRRRLSSRGGLHGTVSRGEVQDKGPQASGGEELANKRKRPTGNLLTQQLKRSTPNRSSLFIDCGPGQPHWGWAWLDLWTHARPWEIRNLEDSKNSKENSKDSKDSKDFIEIIPSRKNSKDFTTKEVDVNTLKVKYYEDYIPNPTPAKCRSSSPMAEKKDFAKSPSPMVEKKVSAKPPSPMIEKKEFVKSSSPMAEKKESAKSSRPMVEKKEPVARSPSPMAEKKEPVRSPSSLVEKKEPAARSPSTFSEKKKPVVSSSPASEKKDFGRSPSSTLSEKKEPESVVPGCVVVPEWQHSGVPVPSPVPLPAPPLAHSHRVISKPPPIEVSTHPGVEEDRPAQVLEPSTPEPQKSPTREKSVPPSPAASEDSIPVPPSPQASDASLPVPETPPGLDSARDDPSVTMGHLVLPEADTTSGGEPNGDSITDQLIDSLSASNGEHQLGEDTPSDKGSASDVVNGHTSNGHQENGDKSRKGEKVGENGDSPVPSKRPTCRYMAATESAKAKFRSSSNPKTRAPDTPESPGRTPKRYSIGGTPPSKGADSPKTAFGTRKTNSFQNRGSPSPKAGVPKEIKPRSADTGAESPARRNSLGGGMRWRT